jgi:hypothetical protein
LDIPPSLAKLMPRTKLAWALAIANTMGLGLGALGAYSKLAVMVQTYAPSLLIEAFVWSTFAVNFAIYGVLCTIFTYVEGVKARAAAFEQELRASSKLVADHGRLAALGCELNHRMIEEVRVCADTSDPSMTYDCQSSLQFPLGTGFRDWLRLRLGQDRAFFITVKAVIPGKKTITAVFRDSAQPKGTRPPLEVEPLDDSHIFHRMRSSREPWVLVRDTEQVQNHHTGGNFRARASARGYRSTVTIPVRGPGLKSDSASASQLLGFLSIDCPEPNAFDDLFELCAGCSSASVYGEGFKPKPGFDMFLALADAMACILLVTKQRSSFPPDRTSIKPMELSHDGA